MVMLLGLLQRYVASGAGVQVSFFATFI